MRLAIAVAAAIGVVCAQAEAAVYTTGIDLNVSLSDVDDNYPHLAFVPNFDYTLGTLTGTTFTIFGVAQETIFYNQSLPPASGTFIREVQFNADAPITLSTAPITAASFANATTLQDRFSVNASSITYSTSYNAPPGSPLDVSFSVESITQPLTCCAYTSLTLTGRLTAAYSYIPVPEPISASLLLAPMLGLASLRRRHAVTATGYRQSDSRPAEAASRACA